MEDQGSGLFVDYRRYKSLFDHNHDAICAIDPSGNFVEWNPAFENLTEWPGSALSNMSYMDLVFPSDMECVNDRLGKYFNGEIIREATVRIKSKTRRNLIVLAKLVPIWIDNKIVGLHAIMKDVTVQKELENALRKQEDLLAHSQRIARVGSWEFDPVKQTSLWSAELFNIYGITNTGYITLQNMVEYIHPEDRERFIRSAKALSKGQPYDIEFRIIRPDGEMRILRSKREMFMDEGEMRLLGVVCDITEQKNTEELLLKSEKLSAIGQLAAGVAHELRNPLTSLKGFLKMIPKAQSPERYIEIMENELNRIEQVTNEFLALAKPQMRKFCLIDVSQKLTDVLDLLNAQALMKNIELHLHNQVNHAQIECEPQLEQVFINLIKNAIEATPIGGRVVVQMEYTDDEAILLRITDNGPGIPQANLAKLGEPFFTTKENGTGLGLMISQKIILEHYGKLEIVSDEGKGTTVRVVLPCRQPQK